MLPMLGALVVIGLYHHVATGQFGPLYSHVSDPLYAEMQTQLGFTIPQFAAVWGLLFGTARGLFVTAPGLILVFAALRSRRLQIAGTWLLSGVILFGSYYMWSGGWAYGPRH